MLVFTIVIDITASIEVLLPCLTIGKRTEHREDAIFEYVCRYAEGTTVLHLSTAERHRLFHSMHLLGWTPHARGYVDSF